ncbi:hypothetical protein D3C81_2327840 [compost metagenome]
MTDRRQLGFIHRFGKAFNAVIAGMHFHQQTGIFIHCLTVIAGVRPVSGTDLM